MKAYKWICFCCCLSLISSPSLSVEIISSAEKSNISWLDTLLDNLGGSDELDLENGIDWGVLPGPFVNPMQGFGVGVAAIGLYSPKGRHASTQVSTLGIKSYASTSGSFGFGIENSTYFGDDTWRAEIAGWLSHAPQYYWGVGRHRAESNQFKTEVESNILHISPSVSYQFLQYTFLSLGLDYHSYQDIQVKGDSLSLSQQIDSHISGMTMGLSYDSRDVAFNSYKGMLLDFSYDHYDKVLGSEFNFTRTTFNYRQYKLLSAKFILAWELYVQGLSGNVPWYAMAEMGVNGRMRGYYQGQYRDKYQMSSQIELRHKINYRHGFVYWIGAGNVAPEFNQVVNSSWLPNMGIGYRLTFKPRVNIRFDMGFGKDTSGFYFQINEAF